MVIFCFASLKAKDTKCVTFVDRFKLSTPMYVKTSGYQIVHLNAEQRSMFLAKYIHFHERLQYSYIQIIHNISKAKYHWVLNKYISGLESKGHMEIFIDHVD